ncbi:helix-turn-helix domain-containing protein [Gordoniibacillus kamchatkensis]|uniref:helix-turn-helix domain-containing protein n=1 Tax=Gordoniibacillus kamchatkensis TaxID=1590651 RepID=UPI001E4C037D|nr:helix-turn-helix domain-containing protein [Paenibacillus sp. VKM B-2647]
MISPDKAVELLGLRPRTIRAWLQSGKLSGIKLGPIWRIRKEDIDRLLLAGGAPSPKLNRIPEPLFRLVLEDGRAVSVVDSTEGLLVVAVNGKYRATIQPTELLDLLRALIRGGKVTAELAGG